ncbi:DUF1579 domain-containing protein [Nodosilinea sp. LEGE 07088]|uniref:DUF1579 domain-containing protein n=1 Tax=Nodosilinea sp. LEGE 07088 TaxID=2777968 RepID=UPI00187E529F|nr:DUF1579 domain-containing protein [Nodosilinea sp. LEGE 07088]MBE9138259.1 DUF1579 domain-containing protein [Nodosilinea sp. LEGE 07088]
MTTTTTTPQDPMTFDQPQPEHSWLQKMVGEWTYDTEASMEPDQPKETFSGTESVRSLGAFWVIAEAQGMMCGDDTMTSVMTLGYDPQKGYVGTWIGSMMSHLWIYDGEMDEAKRVLTLTSEGPAMTGSGTAQYRDIIEFKSDDHRVMTSYLQGDDGQWQLFMTANYRRVSS